MIDGGWLASCDSNEDLQILKLKIQSHIEYNSFLRRNLEVITTSFSALDVRRV